MDGPDFNFARNKHKAKRARKQRATDDLVRESIATPELDGLNAEGLGSTSSKSLVLPAASDAEKHADFEGSPYQQQSLDQSSKHQQIRQTGNSSNAIPDLTDDLFATYDSQEAGPSNIPGPNTQTASENAGRKWRMMKIKRTFDMAKDQRKNVEDVAIERFGSLEAWNDALVQNRLDLELNGEVSSMPKPSKVMSRTQSVDERTINKTSTPPGSKEKGLRDLAPIPIIQAQRSLALSPSSLNKLQAKALKAVMNGDDDADELQAQFDEERARFDQNQKGKTPLESSTIFLDAQNRMIDLGTGHVPHARSKADKRRQNKIETRDPKTGVVLRIDADDDQITLDEMVREAKINAKRANTGADMDYASRIVQDGAFKNDEDYIEESAASLARKKVRSDLQRKAFATGEYLTLQKALDTCPYCFQDNQAPTAPIISCGSTSYLALPPHEGLTPDHCLIVPLQHHLTCVEADEDTWEEVRNFMKCLIKLHTAQKRGVVFFETVCSLKDLKHSYIEAVPVSQDLFADISAYFKEAILAVESEWSQNRRLIEFTDTRPFKRIMPPNLPYFVCFWNYQGSAGYGHIIEGLNKATRDDTGHADDNLESTHNGGEIALESTFAHEILANLLQLPMSKWRKPETIDSMFNQERVDNFINRGWTLVDWTKALPS